MSAFHDQRLLSSRSGSAGWLQRAVLALLGAVLVVVGFFFLTVALIAGAILALGIGVRLWWVVRRLRAQAKASAPLEGQYTVIQGKGVIEERRPS